MEKAERTLPRPFNKSIEARLGSKTALGNKQFRATGDVKGWLNHRPSPGCAGGLLPHADGEGQEATAVLVVVLKTASGGAPGVCTA
jgi:hypothetical protein